MKTPSQYLAEARRARAWGFGCLVFVALLVPVLLFAVLDDKSTAAWVLLGVTLLLFCAGLRLLALARRKEVRAVTEEYFRAREIKAVQRRDYPPVISSQYQR
jgi:hypothetical protein